MMNGRVEVQACERCDSSLLEYQGKQMDYGLKKN